MPSKTPEGYEPSATPFKELSRNEQDHKREQTPPDILRLALDDQTLKIADALDKLGPDARSQKTGRAGQLNRELTSLTSSRSAVDLWERETATKRKVGAATPSFKSFVKGLTEAAESDRLPGNTNMAILDAADWINGTYYRNVTDTYNLRDEVEEAEQKELAEELEAELRSRPQPKLEVVPDPTDTESKQDARKVEARADIERAVLMQEILTIADKSTYILTDLTRGFTVNAGDNPDRTGAARHLNFNERIQETLRKSQQPAPGWTRIPIEAVAFTPVKTMDTTLVYTERTVKTGMFRTEKQTDAKEVDVPDSEHAVTMINPATGESEPVILFQYAFSDQGKYNPNSGEGNFRYREFNGGRGGNELKVALELPESVANRIKNLVKDQPELVRDLIKDLAIKRSNGAITQELWDHGNNVNGNPVRPPYEDLPPTWKISILESDGFAIDTTRSYNQSVRTFGDKSTGYDQDEELSLAA
jgi:hypothetical protein